MKSNVITKIIGYILITPALISVFVFFLDAMDTINFPFNNLHIYWTGHIEYGDGNGAAGFTSSLPTYFGLMGIAGAYLIKEKK
jgi:hypothetical protein